MGFFNEIKKVIFGAKAVTKSAAGKATDFGKEKSEDFLESADDLLGKAKDGAGDLGSTVLDKGSDMLEKAKDMAGDFTGTFGEKAGDFLDGAKEKAGNVYEQLAENDTVNQAGSMAENVGGKVMETGNDLAKKAGSIAENVGGKIIETTGPLVEKAGGIAEGVGGVILDKGGDLMEKGKDVSEIVGSKILDIAGDVSEKAKDLGSTLTDKTNDLMDKANAAAAQDSLDNQIDEAQSLSDRLADKIQGKDVLDQKDPPIGYDKLDESLLDGKDDFWSKAEKFADGNYSGETPKVEEAPLNDIFANTEERQKQLEEKAEKAPFKGEIKGFTDIDGDGDPMIDDAILDED